MVVTYDLDIYLIIASIPAGVGVLVRTRLHMHMVRAFGEKKDILLETAILDWKLEVRACCKQITCGVRGSQEDLHLKMIHVRKSSYYDCTDLISLMRGII